MKSTIGLEASVGGTRESEVEAAGTKHCEGVTCVENWYIRQTTSRPVMTRDDF